jgi:hypothetical protein
MYKCGGFRYRKSHTMSEFASMVTVWFSVFIHGKLFGLKVASIKSSMKSSHSVLV